MALEGLFLNEDNIGKRVRNFFDQSSFYVPNKFIVALYGEYVTKAIAKMALDIEKSDITLRASYRQAFENWKNSYFIKNGEYVDLGWTCQGVTIPNVSSETEDGDFLLDAIKGIRYPLIKSHTKIQTLTLKIIEDRKIMMYQFFNALTNQFHVAKALKPRSSFHKLSIIVIALTQNESAGISTVDQLVNRVLSLSEGTTPTDQPNSTRITSIPGQIFEFNSAVLNNVDTINLSNNNKAPLEYNVSFKVPNTFQSSFNTALKGLRDNTSDQATLDIATDVNMLSGKNADGTIDINKIQYNRDFLEEDPKKLRDGLRKFEV